MTEQIKDLEDKIKDLDKDITKRENDYNLHYSDYEMEDTNDGYGGSYAAAYNWAHIESLKDRKVALEIELKKLCENNK
jgi:hypothetical protein